MATKRNAAPTPTGRPEVYMKTYGGKLEAALEILKNRYHRDFPAFLKALEGYTGALDQMTGAGTKLASELSRMGTLYKTAHGQAWGRLGQSLSEVEAVRQSLTANINKRFSAPMAKKLADDKKDFLNNEKKVKNAMQQYDAEIERLIGLLDKDAPAGTDRMLVNLGALSKKVSEYDAVNAEMLRDLQQSQQKQYIAWSEHWHSVVGAHLEFHTAMEKKLGALASLWRDPDGSGGGASATTTAAAASSAGDGDDESDGKPSTAAPAPQKKDKGEKAAKADKGDKEKDKADKPTSDKSKKAKATEK